MFDGRSGFDAQPALESKQSLIDDAILGRIVAVFERTFAADFQTRLCPGADEPLYLPASEEVPEHRIFSRENFPASALHEVAHWCVAGEARRRQIDFGYWYAADGRDARQQRAFEQVEVKPQAIEWAFSRAVGLGFRVSVDNLGGEATDPFGFQLAVWQQARFYEHRGLPVRAERFCRALEGEFGEEFGGQPGVPSLAELLGNSREVLA